MNKEQIIHKMATVIKEQIVEPLPLGCNTALALAVASQCYEAAGIDELQTKADKLAEAFEKALLEVRKEIDAQYEESKGGPHGPCARMTVLIAREELEKALAEYRGGDSSKSTVTDTEKSLWQMLDDVDTAVDMFKPELTPFVKYIVSLCEKRHSVLRSDGYILSKPASTSLQKESE